MHTQRIECEVLINFSVCIVRPDPIYFVELFGTMTLTGFCHP